MGISSLVLPFQVRARRAPRVSGLFFVCDKLVVDGMARTGTSIRTRDFKSLASTNSAKGANAW